MGGACWVSVVGGACYVGGGVGSLGGDWRVGGADGISHGMGGASGINRGSIVMGGDMGVVVVVSRVGVARVGVARPPCPATLPAPQSVGRPLEAA